MVLLVASDIGSPSAPADASYLSHSSANTILIGLDASPDAELEPTMFKLPPANFLDRTVLPESLLLGSLTQSLIFSESLIIIASLSLEKA